MSVLEDARRRIEAAVDDSNEAADEDEDPPQRFDDCPRWLGNMGTYRGALRDAYDHIEAEGEATTADLVDVMGGRAREGWFFPSALPTLRAEPGVTFDGWTIDVEPLDDEELRDRVNELHQEDFDDAHFVRGLIIAAYRELREGGPPPTKPKLMERASDRTNMSADKGVWNRVFRHLRGLDCSGPDRFEGVWSFDPEQAVEPGEGGE